MSKKHKILFVCLGNICRSPMAEEIFRQITVKRGVKDNFEIDSAGTYAGHEGEKADARMRKAAETCGYNITHRSRPLRSMDFQNFDLILVMDDKNLDNALSMAGSLEDCQKIRRIVYYSTQSGLDHIPDPYYGGLNGFENVIDMLEDCCEGLYRDLMNTVQ